VGEQLRSPSHPTLTVRHHGIALVHLPLSLLSSIIHAKLLISAHPSAMSLPTSLAFLPDECTKREDHASSSPSYKDELVVPTPIIDDGVIIENIFPPVLLRDPHGRLA